MKNLTEPILLSATERKTCILMMRDFSVSDVAEFRCLSRHTIVGHNKSVREKTKCANIYAALLKLYRLGIITDDELDNEVIA